MKSKYYYTVGLEIHAELKTKSKMFCACKNDPDEESPNKNVCPVCMAHPGALPVINKQAIEYVIKVGLALDSNIADFTEFDRKNYFYPDIPKGYQISQYKYPIVVGGHLANMGITRIHLEEDTGNNKHFDKDGGYSLIDFNRAGVPLMELVTEPHTFEDPEETAKTASNFAKEYQLLLWYLGASEANMEKGEFRVEANVSVSTEKGKLSPQYVEVKNLNSFKTVERAIKYEYERMIKLIEEGKADEIVKETRGWDEAKQKTTSQRKKEGSADYRYFPDPDLPKMYLHEAFDLNNMKAGLPELPVAKRARYKNDFGIKDEDIEVYINDPVLAQWFEEVVQGLKDPEKVKIASNYVTNDMIGLMKTLLAEGSTRYPSSENFIKLMKMNFDQKINSANTKKLLGNLVTHDDDPEKLATEEGLIQIHDENTIKEVARRVIVNNPKAVEDFKSGKESAVMSLVGQVMKETKGSANPQLARSSILSVLDEK